MLNDYDEISFERSANSAEELKSYMKPGDKLELIWFNDKDAGYINIESKSIGGQVSKSGGLDAETGYNYHMTIDAAAIPWDEIIRALNI